MRMLRSCGSIVVGAVVVTGSALASAATPSNVAGTVVWGDFDGNGVFERAVSSPEDNCNKGAVYILTASSSTTKWTRDTTGVLGTAACDDYFGAALAAGDFNKDGKDDLAIGAPGADDAGVSAAGAVHVLYGSSTGLTESGDQLWHQNSTGIDDTAEVDDFFGEVLAAGDFNCDTADELVVGVPSENIGSATTDAGAVQVLYGSTGGVTSSDSLFYQGNGGVDGTAESTDRFGAALAIGNFNKDAASGHGCYDLAVGSPTEDSGTLTDVGWVYTIKGGTTGLSTTGDLAFDQNTTGVVDNCESGDRFGERLLVGDENDDSYDDLAVIVPGDSCHTGHGVGRHVFRGSSTGITTTGNHLECDVFHCNIVDAENAYGCPADSTIVWASANADVVEMFAGNDTVMAAAGNDTVLGWHGNDVIVGGAGNDTIDPGTGKDAVIAGAGNDIIVIDRECAAVAGKVIDGGPGTDTVKSNLSSTALASHGVVLTSIESYVTISEGTGTCEPFPFEEGPFARPKLALSWVNLPELDSVWSTTGDTVSLTRRERDAGSGWRRVPRARAGTRIRDPGAGQQHHGRGARHGNRRDRSRHDRAARYGGPRASRAAVVRVAAGLRARDAQRGVCRQRGRASSIRPHRERQHGCLLPREGTGRHLLWRGPDRLARGIDPAIDDRSRRDRGDRRRCPMRTRW